MKKLKRLPILIILVMLSFSIGFFTLFKWDNSSFDTFADITGVSGEVVNLTGSQGYQPYHYFTDGNGDSTLVAAEGDLAESYYNEKGELCHIMSAPLKTQSEFIMTNNFAFGGINTSIVFKRTA